MVIAICLTLKLENGEKGRKNIMSSHAIPSSRSRHSTVDIKHV